MSNEPPPLVPPPKPTGGGFPWQLTPGGSAEPPPEPVPTPAPAVEPSPPAPVEPSPAPAETEAMPTTVEPAPPVSTPSQPTVAMPSHPDGGDGVSTVAMPTPEYPPVAPPTPLVVPPTLTPASPLDELFGESAYRDYEAAFVPAAPRATNLTAPPPRVRMGQRTQRRLLASSVAVIAVAAIAALFVLGTRLPKVLGPAPAVAASPTASSSPSVVISTGPAAIGVQKWDALHGGECINPYTTPWSLTFTVVDCATPHSAQLVVAAAFPNSSDASAKFPGAAALAAQIPVLCSATGVLDLTMASKYTDIQFQGTYPVTAAQWASGQRNYYCFVSRSGGGPLTGSLASRHS